MINSTLCITRLQSTRMTIRPITASRSNCRLIQKCSKNKLLQVQRNVTVKWTTWLIFLRKFLNPVETFTKTDITRKSLNSKSWILSITAEWPHARVITRPIAQVKPRCANRRQYFKKVVTHLLMYKYNRSTRW